MTVNITIIGMGKIGTSAGLALARHTGQLHRIGHDIHPEFSRRAHKLGAVDKVAYNLPGSVADADIILLALPADQIRDTLKYIAHDLKDGAVVMDTAPTKGAVSAWAGELLPGNRYYVGLSPVINPKYILVEASGGDAAREDLFENGMIGITAPRGTSSAALKLASDLTSLLRSKPLFMDITEVDSLMAATHLVPQLIAAGLIGATVNQPGWAEGRKVAGAPYALGSSALGAIDPPEAIANAAALNREHVIRVLDNVMLMLISFKEKLQDGEYAVLAEQLKQIRDAREDWLGRRFSGEWDEGPAAAELPTAGDEMRRFILGRRRE
jgi:prephenate dehydrogenase